VLAVPARTHSVVYVLDRSLSMGPSGGLVRARRELRAALAELPSGASFQVIVYNQSAKPLRMDGKFEFLPAEPRTIEAVERELDGVAASGRTDHARAVQAGLRLRPDVLFLITDADDLTEAEVREVTRRNAGQTNIHTIELSTRRGGENGPLYRLATLNGGTYCRVPPAE
jgi:hypothetical protein